MVECCFVHFKRHPFASSSTNEMKHLNALEYNYYRDTERNVSITRFRLRGNRLKRSHCCGREESLFSVVTPHQSR